MKEALGGLLIQAVILGAVPTYAYFYPPKPADLVEIDGATMTVEELLDEIDQDPTREFEIDRYIFPLFNQLLNKHGFQFSVITTAQDFVRCRIMKKAY